MRDPKEGQVDGIGGHTGQCLHEDFLVEGNQVRVAWSRSQGQSLGHFSL